MNGSGDINVNLPYSVDKINIDLENTRDVNVRFSNTLTPAIARKLNPNLTQLRLIDLLLERLIV